MKKSPSWTPTYKISAPRQLHPLVGRPRAHVRSPTLLRYRLRTKRCLPEGGALGGIRMSIYRRRGDGLISRV